MKRKDNFILQTVGGEDILVPLGQQVINLNGLVVLNNTGRFLWELLAEDRSPDDLTELLASRFEVDRPTATRDVQSFLDHISGMGLLEA
jgi:hypothetical protein